VKSPRQIEARKLVVKQKRRYLRVQGDFDKYACYRPLWRVLRQHVLCAAEAREAVTDRYTNQPTIPAALEEERHA
jgi:hypothetical protein